MRSQRPSGLAPSFLLLGMIVALTVTPGRAPAQPPPESGLPNPRLTILTPPGAKAGATIELTFVGSDVEEPQALLFSDPGIKAELILPPPPPKPDPKKPAPPPAPAPIPRFKVTVSPQTPVGIHDVRLVNKWGVSNPRAFVVGDLPEVLEKEPNNEVEQAQRIEINTTVNGSVSAPTDVDYYVFAGKKGQRIIASCLTTSIDSRLHAALELYDRAGRQLAANHHYQDGDALLDCTLPEDGDYGLRLHGFTYLQGDAEHFYRLTVSTAPWIDAVFPPMVQPGKPTLVTVYGRNLPGGRLDPTAIVDGCTLERVSVSVTAPADAAAYQRLTFSGRISPALAGTDGFEYRLRNAVGISNPFLITLARTPIILDNESNDTPETAQAVPVPCDIAGRIEKRRDRDWYRFSARKGETLDIEVFSERLGVKADLYFVVRNAATKQDLGEFDDDPETLSPNKFFTHTDDPPRFHFVAPADGMYHLLVSSREANVRAGPRQLYRVTIAPEQPDFRLITLPLADSLPDSCRLLQKGEAAFTVLAWRRDGFNGPITLSAEGLPPGVSCPPQTIGTGMKQQTLVLTAAANAQPAVKEFTIKGTAAINGQTITRAARPASITWAVPPGTNLPTLSRLDRNLLLAVRENAPYRVTATLDKTQIVQGDKANLTAKLARFWPDLKMPLQLLAVDLPPNVTVNNNQPLAIAPNADTAVLPVATNPAVLPGSYTLVLRTGTQSPYNKDPKAKDKPAVNIVQPSTPVTLIILPKQVATLSLANPNITAKVGTRPEVALKLARMYDYAGDFQVEVVLPPAVKGVSADKATVPAGKDEAKIILRVAADAAPGNRTDLIVRATALLNGKVPIIQEIKFNLNVTK